MILPSFKHRSYEAEIIDDLSFSGKDLVPTFRAIESINYWLGGNKVSLRGVKKVLQPKSNGVPKKKVRILDLGCGSGDGLRALADWGIKQNFTLVLEGWDANPHIIELAKEKSSSYANIVFKVINIFDDGVRYANYDIVVCGLFLHHFKETEIIELFQKIKEDGAKALVINDLHRHWLAYSLFNLLCFVFRYPKVAWMDGLLSIRKGFIRSELELLARSAQLIPIDISWKWAFRFQMIWMG